MSCLGSAQTFFQFCSQDRDVRLPKHRIAISGHHLQTYVCCVHPVQVRMRMSSNPDGTGPLRKTVIFPSKVWGSTF